MCVFLYLKRFLAGVAVLVLRWVEKGSRRYPSFGGKKRKKCKKCSNALGKASCLLVVGFDNRGFETECDLQKNKCFGLSVDRMFRKKILPWAKPPIPSTIRNLVARHNIAALRSSDDV